MRRLLILLAALGVLVGCAPGTVEPGDGPAAEPTEVVDSDGPHESDEPTDDPTLDEEAPQQVASFNDKYTYPDGLVMEVIRIKNAEFTRAEALYDDGEPKGMEKEKPGDPYTKMTVRIKNGSAKTQELSAPATYGPDGTEAVKSYLLDADSGIDGKLIPGKSRSGDAVYLIPKKYRGDVVMEFTPDYDHGSAVFAGSVE